MGLAVAGDLPVDTLKALPYPGGDFLDELAAARPSAISIRSSWLRYLLLTGVSAKLTLSASMNHSDPQLRHADLPGVLTP